MDSGVFKRGKLLETMTRKEFDRAVTDGRLRPLRHGWVAAADADPEVARVVSAGGVLTCASALRRHGVWMAPTSKTHARGSTSSVRGHPRWCKQHGRPPTVTGSVDDLATALRYAARCLSREEFVAACDSILNRSLMTPSTLEATLGDTPLSVHRMLAQVDGRADSGTETMVRLRLRATTPQIRTQVTIDQIGRVDLLVGRSMIIEVDGYEYHADPEQFENDRLRDLYAVSLGYHPIRLTYRQVMHQWNEVGPLLTEMIRRGDHRRPLISAGA